MRIRNSLAAGILGVAVLAVPALAAPAPAKDLPYRTTSCGPAAGIVCAAPQAHACICATKDANGKPSAPYGPFCTELACSKWNQKPVWDLPDPVERYTPPVPPTEEEPGAIR
jgi:hypothetical protein